jgi:methylated-DNA-[protein]-cysteine S-methyltransferase
VNSLLESYQAKLAAPFAVLGVRTIGERLIGIEYLPREVATLKPQTAFAREVCRQLSAYLKKPSFEFDLAFDYDGTDFQKRVWKAVHAIPSGSVLSYKQVAKKIGSAPRPVGTACGANLIPILIPCHRVVASQGIGGFMNVRRGAAIEVKRWLLHHENPGAY